MKRIVLLIILCILSTSCTTSAPTPVVVHGSSGWYNLKIREIEIDYNNNKISSIEYQEALSLAERIHEKWKINFHKSLYQQKPKIKFIEFP